MDHYQEQGMSGMALVNEAWRLLGASRRRAQTTILWMVALAMLDLFGLASIIPLMILILRPEQTGWIQSLLPGYADPRTAQTALVVVIAVLWIFKYMLSNRINRWKASFAFDTGHLISERLLTSFQRAPLQRHLNADLAEEINRIANLPVVFANNIVIPTLTIAAESVVFLFVLVAVVVVDAHTTLILLVVLLPLGATYLVGTSRARRISSETKAAYPESLKAVVQAIEGFADIRGLQQEEYFAAQCRAASRNFANTLAREYEMLGSGSRITELTAGLLMALASLYVIWFATTPPDLLYLSFLAAAGARFVPSLGRMLQAGLQIHRHLFVLTELANSQVEETSSASVETKLSVEEVVWKGLRFGYQPDQRIVDLEKLVVRKGEVIAVTGPSGSGKTTLLLLMMGWLKGEGVCLVNGVDITQNDSNWNNQFGYLPQQPYLQDASIEENILFGLPADPNRLRRVCEAAGLTSWLQQLPAGWSTVIGEKGMRVSGGQRQRIALARAAYAGRPWLFMDEATSQLDESLQQEVLRSLTQQGWFQTIVMVTHDASVVATASRVLEVSNGKVKEIRFA